MADGNSNGTCSATKSLGWANDRLNYVQAVVGSIDTLGQQILGNLPTEDEQLEALSMAVSSMAFDVSAKLTDALEAIASVRALIDSNSAEAAHG